MLCPAPLHILPKTKATEEFLSFLVVSKLEDRQPLYHLEKQLNARFGVDCSRQTMANWVIGLMEPLQPIFNLMKDDGRLEIDNNLTEQEIKPLVIARKNFMFCASMDGAKALCMHFSFIRTAKLHGLDPYHYYVQLLKSIPHCKSVEDYEKLLPWNINLDYVKKVD